MKWIIKKKNPDVLSTNSELSYPYYITNSYKNYLDPKILYMKSKLLTYNSALTLVLIKKFKDLGYSFKVTIPRGISNTEVLTRVKLE